MKNILITVFILGLVSCSSQKKLEMGDIPFEITKANLQEWSGGRAESGSGAELKIFLSNVSKDLSIDKVYFRERLLDCSHETENNEMIINASFKTNDTLTSSTNDELRSMQKAFKLSKNEAIVCYKSASSALKYAKVGDIKIKEPVLFRGKPKN